MSKKNILITQNHMVNLGGSELVTLELIDFFLENKANVYLYVAIMGGEVEKLLKKRKGVTICIANTSSLKIDKINFEYVIIHHSLIPESLLWRVYNGKFNGKIIWQHMSSYLVLEQPFLHKLESEISDIVLFNSKETEIELSKRINIPKEKKMVFANPVPDYFYKQTRNNSTQLKKVLVISNHPPIEVIKALDLLSKEGIETEIVGIKNKQKVVNPNLLINADVVISIGKTVQYCIAVNTPIYCYDHFGGPGFLNSTNFAMAKKYNFSGRGFKEKTATVIYREIKNQHLQSQKDINTIRKKHGEEFKLSVTMQVLFDKLKKTRHTPKKPSIYDIYSAIDIQEIRVSDIQTIYFQNQSINKYTDAIVSHREALKRHKNDLDYVRSSASWKITKPLREVRNLTKKKK